MKFLSNEMQLLLSTITNSTYAIYIRINRNTEHTHTNIRNSGSMNKYLNLKWICCLLTHCIHHTHTIIMIINMIIINAVEEVERFQDGLVFIVLVVILCVCVWVRVYTWTWTWTCKCQIRVLTKIPNLKFWCWHKRKHPGSTPNSREKFDQVRWSGHI